MALVLNQVTTSSSGPTLLCNLAGGCTVTFATITSASTVYIGTVAANLSTGNGFPVAAGAPPLSITLPATSAPVAVYGIGSTGTPVIGVAIVTTA